MAVFRVWATQRMTWQSRKSVVALFGVALFGVALGVALFGVALFGVALFGVALFGVALFGPVEVNQFCLAGHKE